MAFQWLSVGDYEGIAGLRHTLHIRDIALALPRVPFPAVVHPGIAATADMGSVASTLMLPLSYPRQRFRS